MRQVLLNLLSNAIKFTARGEVGLTVRTDEGHVLLEVSDSGIGIAPEEVDHIFEPFHQASRGATREAGGTGLGLTVSRRLALALGGDLTVRSTVGEGSVFTLSLPEDGVEARGS